MKKIPGIVLSGILILVALYIADCHGRRAGARDAKLETERAHVDTVIREVGRDYSRDSLRYAQQNDSLGRVIRRLRETLGDSRIGGAISKPRERVSPSPIPAPANDPRDSLIDALFAGRRADSLRVLFLQRSLAIRDSLLTVVRGQRDQYRNASRKRLHCGPGASFTIGIDGRAAYGPSFGCVLSL